MDDEKIINVAEEATKKQPWYKRAWKKAKEIGNKVVDFYWDHIEIICGIIWGVAVALWSWLFGWIAGRQEGYNIGKADGKREGFNEGYVDCVKDLKSSGYQMYGGYGDDAGKVIVKKISEENETDL